MDIDHIDDVVANSWKDFHAPGLDYICLRRSPTETVKLYFYDGEPHIANPHDHRYPFDTTCLAGQVTNLWYREGDGLGHQRYDFYTPLKGGHGFEPAGESKLRCSHHFRATPGMSYSMTADEIHAVILQPGTVLLLRQYASVVPDGEPTRTFARSAPSLEGRYNRFTPDEVIDRLKALDGLLVASAA